jgi:hypothetical protein
MFSGAPIAIDAFKTSPVRFTVVITRNQKLLASG